MVNSSMYERVVESYKTTKSIAKTTAELGISKITVRRVLITEGLWESKRSREIMLLFNEGYAVEEIADKLVLSVKNVENYMPYTKGMNNNVVTKNSIASKEKRERMKKALARQQGKVDAQTSTSQNDGVVMIDKTIVDNKGAYERMERIVLGEPVRKEDRPDVSARRYAPSVLKLHLELVDYNGAPLSFTDDENDILKKHAGFKHSFSREVLVPGNMSLVSLNYMIQKLYGWQNSHLHSFVLENKLFDALTSNGNLEKWENLCGVLFRYPDEDYLDKYCNDNYDGTKSYKTWLKSKYSGAQISFSVGDAYIENRRLVEELEDRIGTIRASKKVSTVREIHRTGAIAGEYDSLLERLQLNNLFYAKGKEFNLDNWLNVMQVEIAEKEKVISAWKNKDEYLLLLNGLSELRRRRVTQAELERVINRGYDFSKAEPTTAERAYADNSKVINYYQEECNKLLSAMEPQISPFTDTLLYRYDFGDDWCVKVVCEEAYYINDYWDFPNEQGWITIVVQDKERVKDWDFYSCLTDQKISGSFAETLRTVAQKKAPICIGADGMTLLEDVGGIYGFIDMLKTIYGDDVEDATGKREWAKSMGWTGRTTKLKNML